MVPTQRAVVGTRETFYRRYGKRAFDLCVASGGLVVLSPLLLVIAAIIKTSDPRLPAFYLGRRGGRDSRPFTIVKFRTMVGDASLGGPITRGLDDERITRIGRILRRTKADELPQLVNVIRGDMSIVGPRPLETAELADYQRDPRIESVRPGITDRGSLYFLHRQGNAFGIATDAPYEYVREAKDRMAIESIERCSLTEDLRVIIATVMQAFR